MNSVSNYINKLKRYNDNSAESLNMAVQELDFDTLTVEPNQYNLYDVACFFKSRLKIYGNYQDDDILYILKIYIEEIIFIKSYYVDLFADIEESKKHNIVLDMSEYKYEIEEIIQMIRSLNSHIRDECKDNNVHVTISGSILDTIVMFSEIVDMYTDGESLVLGWLNTKSYIILLCEEIYDANIVAE